MGARGDIRWEMGGVFEDYLFSECRLPIFMFNAWWRPLCGVWERFQDAGPLFPAMAPVLNGCLDLRLVVGFGMGVKGAGHGYRGGGVCCPVCRLPCLPKVPLLQLKRGGYP